MLTFHGVSKDEIIESLTQAAGFVHSLNIGPHANAWAQNYVAGADGIKQLQQAITPEEFRDAIRPVCTRLSHYFNIFKTHAILNTSKQGKDVYVSLCWWRPFGAVSLDPYAPAEEADKHVDSLHPKRKPLNAFAVGKYIAKCMAAREDVLDGKKFAADPISTYGIVMSEADSPMSGEVMFSPEFRELTETLIDDLIERVRSGEVSAIGSRSFEVNGKHKQCIFVDATREVAQQLADRFAAKKEVITDKGEVVHPSNHIQTPAINQGRASDGVAKDISTGSQKR